MKLWDLRKMNEIKDLKNVSDLCAMDGFDYRWMDYTYKPIKEHKLDNSVMTFTGHTVLQTLIRCYFSPLETTGQRYLYSGSADGSIYIFDILSGENKTCISSKSNDCIRDVSWHPNVPVIIATSFDGSLSIFSKDDNSEYKNRNQRKKAKEMGHYGTNRAWSSDEDYDDDVSEGDSDTLDLS
jgi:WD repeat-containing protein 23